MHALVDIAIPVLLERSLGTVGDSDLVSRGHGALTLEDSQIHGFGKGTEEPLATSEGPLSGPNHGISLSTEL